MKGLSIEVQHIGVETKGSGETLCEPYVPRGMKRISNIGITAHHFIEQKQNTIVMFY